MAISGALMSLFDSDRSLSGSLWIRRIMQSGFGHVHAVHEARKIGTAHSSPSTGVYGLDRIV